MIALEFDRVSRDFLAPDGKPYRALEDVSLAIPTGAFVAIVGPSGCGKTTLLNLAAGLLPATSGCVRVNGKEFAGLNTHDAFGTGSYPSAVLYTETSWLDAHRDMAARLARAIVKTLRWMQAHSEEEIAAKAPSALRGEDFALYVDALKNSRPMFSTDGVMPADGAAAVRDVLAASNPKVKGALIDLSQTYTNEFTSR